MILGLCIAMGVFTIDQLTKAWLFGKSVALIGDFFVIESVWNDGAAFSMLSGKLWLFIALTIPFLVLFPVLLSLKRFQHPLWRVGLGLCFGGMLGNFIDRICFGAVRDLFYFKSINFAIFNIADACLCAGVVVLLVYIFFYMEKETNTHKEHNSKQQ